MRAMTMSQLLLLIICHTIFIFAFFAISLRARHTTSRLSLHESDPMAQRPCYDAIITLFRHHTRFSLFLHMLFLSFFPAAMLSFAMP